THCDSLPAPWRGPPTALETAPDSGIRLYPNPARDHLILQLAARHLPAELELWDSQGRLVYQQPLTELQTRVDVSALAGGLYVGKISSSQGLVVRPKIVLNR
ncbi:MAG: T9SS C-terminal target domain-containing protein, partial [Bacteroidetes bacterium]